MPCPGGRVVVETGRADARGRFSRPAARGRRRARPVREFVCQRLPATAWTRPPCSHLGTFLHDQAGRPREQGSGSRRSMARSERSESIKWAESAPGRGTIVSVYWPEDLLRAEQLIESGAAPRVERGTETAGPGRERRTPGAVAGRYAARPARLSLLQWRRLPKTHCGWWWKTRSAPTWSSVTSCCRGERRVAGEELGIERPGLPMLFMSGFTDEEVIRRGLLRVCRPFLQKPFAPGEARPRSSPRVASTSPTATCPAGWVLRRLGHASIFPSPLTA